MLKLFGHKDRRKRLLKSMALVIGICYLISPFNQQMYHVLHSISHTLSPPQQFIGHSINKGTDPHMHSAGDHILVQANHEHEVIDLVKALFDNSEEQGHDGPIPTHKVDKHLTIYLNYVKEQYINGTKEAVHSNVKSLLEGHTYLWAEPPIV